MKFRPIRVGDLIQKELSELIQREFEFDSALITLSSVEVDKKMERALINISVIPSEKLEEVVKTLEKAQGYLYHLLFKKINIKPMPHLMFRPDRGFENAARVEKTFLESKKFRRLKKRP
ncbi:MAG TPA: 30S ribosome-binding factor RbfA [Candidatus Paceibacterota bacterium]